MSELFGAQIFENFGGGAVEVGLVDVEQLVGVDVQQPGDALGRADLGGANCVQTLSKRIYYRICTVIRRNKTPYWCRNKTLFEQPLIRSRKKI